MLVGVWADGQQVDCGELAEADEIEWHEEDECDGDEDSDVGVEQPDDMVAVWLGLKLVAAAIMLDPLSC